MAAVIQRKGFPCTYGDRRPCLGSNRTAALIGGPRRCWKRCEAKRSESQERQPGLNPALEAPVPVDQRPVNELRQLKESQLYSWATMPLQDYLTRLALLFAAAFVVLSGPIAAQTFDPVKEPLSFGAAGVLGALVVVGGAGVRMYLGWKYVGDRLLTASLEYEETGWYDGQIFVKPPEVLTRDRLLGIYQVKPVLQRLTRTLQATGAGLGAAVLALVLIPQQHPMGFFDATGQRIPSQVTPSGIIYSDRVKDLSELALDDEAAEAEAKAQGGMPGYCGDRYYRAFAGGQYCKKFDAK